jgi:hypothetical protein
VFVVWPIWQLNAILQGFLVARPEGAKLPQYTKEHFEEIENTVLPANFDKTCILLVDEATFYNPDCLRCDGIQVCARCSAYCVPPTALGGHGIWARARGGGGDNSTINNAAERLSFTSCLTVSAMGNRGY